MTDTLLSVEDLTEALSAIVDAAEGRDLTDAEEGEISALETQLEAAQARRERTEAFRARQAQRAAIATPALHVKGKPSEAGNELDAAFTAYLRTGRENADLTELRAQSLGTDSAGGYTVPQGFRDKLTERRKAFGGIANVAEEINTSDGRPIEWPTLDDTANTAQIVAENTAPSANGADMVFGTRTLGANKYVATGASNVPLKVSVELLQDSAFDVEALVARKLGERIARAQAPHLVNGTGSSQPKGIAHGLTPVELGTALSYANLLSVVHAVDPAYRENARWAFNDATLQAIRGIVDTTGRPLLTDQNRGIEDKPGEAMLLGYPVTIDQAFTTYDAADDDLNMGVFGDLREGYVIRNVKSIELLVNPYSRMQYRQIEYSAWFRFDAIQQNTNAYNALTGHNG